jgi:regulator of replication initiation timing
LFGQKPGPKVQWEELEKRINRLLEGIVQLRNANAQLMKENVHLKNQVKDFTANSNGSNPAPEDTTLLKRQYEAALQDLKQVKQNLQRLETLAQELKLED